MCIYLDFQMFFYLLHRYHILYSQHSQNNKFPIQHTKHMFALCEFDFKSFLMIRKNVCLSICLSVNHAATEIVPTLHDSIDVFDWTFLYLFKDKIPEKLKGKMEVTVGN